MSLKNGSTAIFANSYGYSSATGRMATVGDGTYTAHYSWQDGTGLMTQNQIKSDSDSSVITTHNRTYGSRLSNYNLLSVSNTTGAATRAYSYVYNTKDQRTRMTLPDGAYWEYAYDDKGQVVSGVKKDAAGNVIPGQSYGYNYDGIGNRNTTKHGMFGNQDTDAITQAYTSNSVNQYTQITTPGIAPVVGEADTDTKVKVIRNDSNAAASGEQVITTDRDGVYFMGMFKNVDNSNSAQTIPYTVYAIKNDYNNNKQFVQKASSSYTVPKSQRTYTYDDDGNMTSDGTWTYTWNGENRMIVAEKSDMKLEYMYDYMGRRVSKKVYTGSTGNWTLSTHQKFVYNGYKQIAEYNASDVLQKTYTWQPVELDVPLWVKDGSTYYYYIVDGNKNVCAMLDASGNEVAQYDYNPFGKIVASSGAYKNTNPYRFSSEYYDAESGLIYYNYRYYYPEAGRWLSRDPIGETGGTNLYGMVNNNPIYHWDSLGEAQNHHPIPWNTNPANPSWNFQNHPLVKAAGLNLKTNQPLLKLENHAGPHTASYKNKIKLMLDTTWNNLSDRTSKGAREALNRTMNRIMTKIENGSLKPYDNKVVKAVTRLLPKKCVNIPQGGVKPIPKTCNQKGCKVLMVGDMSAMVLEKIARENDPFYFSKATVKKTNRTTKSWWGNTTYDIYVVECPKGYRYHEVWWTPSYTKFEIKVKQGCSPPEYYCAKPLDKAIFGPRDFTYY